MDVFEFRNFDEDEKIPEDDNVWKYLEPLPDTIQFVSCSLYHEENLEMDLDEIWPQAQDNASSSTSSGMNPISTDYSASPEQPSYKEIDSDDERLNPNAINEARSYKAHSKQAISAFNKIKNLLGKKYQIDKFIKKHMNIFKKVLKLKDIPEDPNPLTKVYELFKVHKTNPISPEIQDLALQLFQLVQETDIKSEFKCSAPNEKEYNNTYIKRLFSNPNVQSIFDITCKLARYKLLEGYLSKLKDDPISIAHYEKLLKLFYRDDVHN